MKDAACRLINLLLNLKTLISRDKGKFTEKSPLNRSQRRSGSHEHDPRRFLSALYGRSWSFPS